MLMQSRIINHACHILGMEKIREMSSHWNTHNSNSVSFIFHLECGFTK
jgi:hypothetical protein